MKAAQEPFHVPEESNPESTERTASSETSATPITRFMASAPAARSSSILGRSRDYCNFRTMSPEMFTLFLDLRVDWCFFILLPSSCCFSFCCCFLAFLFFNRQTADSVGWDVGKRVGDREFQPWRDQHSGSLNNWVQSVAFVIASANG